jgi:hypothetical protein
MLDEMKKLYANGQHKCGARQNLPISPPGIMNDMHATIKQKLLNQWLLEAPTRQQFVDSTKTVIEEVK